MTTVLTLKTNALNVLQDTSQLNYADVEVWYYLNEGLRFLSIELAKINSRIANKNASPVFSINEYSKDLSTLTPTVTDLLSLVTNENGYQKVFNVTNSYALMKKAEESDIDDWQIETNANADTPSQFYLRGNTLYIHPRAKVSTTIKFYYHPLQAITSDSDTVPWDGLFDNALERFILANCRLRSEQFNYTKIDGSLFNGLKDQAFDILYMRDPLEMGFSPGVGMN
jgi:hypothetical protein